MGSHPEAPSSTPERPSPDESLRLYVHHAPTMVALFDRDMRYLAASRRWCEIYALGDVVGRCHYEVFPDLPPRYREAHLRGLAGEVVVDEADSWQRADGSSQHLRWQVMPWWTAEGTVGGITVTVEDVTPLIATQWALRANERELSAEIAALEVLQRASRSLAGNEPGAIYRTLLDAALTLMRADGASIHMVEVEGTLSLVDSRGLHPDSARFWRTVDAQAPSSCGLALRSGERVVMGDIEADAALAGTRDLAEYRRCGVRAVQSTPLMSRAGVLIGMLSTHWREPHVPAERDLRWFDVLARQAADALERAQAHAAQRDSEARFRALAETAPVLIFEADAEGKNLYVSPQFELYSGTHAGGFRGHAWIKHVHPDDRGPVLTAWARARARGATYEGRYRFRRHDGTYRWFMARGAPIRSDDGTIERWIGVLVDIDDSVRATQALQESEQRFREIADHMSQFAWTADPEGAIYWYNRRWYEYTGTTPDEMLGWGWQAVHHPDHVARVVEKISHCFRTGEPWEDTFPLRGRDGSYRWFLSRAIPIRDEQGHVIRWFGTNTDITLQREAEDALREADRRKDVFLATLSHELRNPLAPLRTAAEILRAPGALPAQLEWAQIVIQRQVRHMAMLLDELLDVSRITQGKLQLKRQRVRLAEVVDSALEAARPVIDRKRHRLSVQLPADDVWLDVDALRVSQVLSNLLTNAGKYTDSGGAIALDASVNGPDLTLRVRDNGIGIAPDALNRVFGMFSQVEDNASRSEGGLGIGLALAKGLVQLHGGRISARSEGAGRGSEFSVELSAVIGCEAPAPVAQATPASSPRRRVLIVDDNKDAADSLALLLQLAGHETRVAYSGQGGLTAAASFRPEAAFLDIGMPQMDGYELATALRRQREGADTYLVALTGWGQDADRQRSREAGFDHHMTKPVDLAAVMALLGCTPIGSGDTA
jgi:PAS domain S-box-containing protein